MLILKKYFLFFKKHISDINYDKLQLIFIVILTLIISSVCNKEDSAPKKTSSYQNALEFPVDHTWCHPFNDIPEEWRSKIKSDIQLLFCGQSHGTQISGNANSRGGLFEVAMNGNGDYNIDRIITGSIPPRWTANSLNFRKVMLTDDDYITPAEFFSGSGGLVNWTDFGNFAVEICLDTYTEINTVAFCWCGELGYHASNDAYLDGFFSAAQYLEDKYDGGTNRKVTFIWMTGHAQFSDLDKEDDGYGLRAFIMNERIREWAQDNDKILFDFADMDVYCPYNNGTVDPASYPWVKDEANDEAPPADPGNRYGTTTINGVSTSGQFETVHFAGWGPYDTGALGHTSYYHTELRAQAFWKLLAVICGWNGEYNNNL